jgi:hypothetical protein
VHPLGSSVEAAEFVHSCCCTDRGSSPGGGCGVSPRVADGDSPTCRFAKFSSKWRTVFSHLYVGFENWTVVHESAGRLVNGSMTTWLLAEIFASGGLR